MRPLLQVVAIHKDVLATRVTVQVAVENHFSLLAKWPDCLFNMEDYRVYLLGRVLVPSVQILSTQRTTIVTIDDAINVYHWDYFENEMLTQRPCLDAVAHQEFDDTFHHPR